MVNYFILFLITVCSITFGVIMSPRRIWNHTTDDAFLVDLIVIFGVSVINYLCYIASGILSHGIALRRLDHILSFVFVSVGSHAVSGLVFF